MKTIYKMEPNVERFRVLCTIYKQNSKMTDNHFIKFLQESLGGYVTGGRETTVGA